MELVLAMDLRQNLVVHENPGTGGLQTADWVVPRRQNRSVPERDAPHNLYIADLDRIEVPVRMMQS